MTGLETYVNQQIENGKDNIESVENLGIILAYDGFDFDNIIEDRKIQKTSEKAWMYYGINPELIGLEINIDKEMKYNYGFYCPVAIILDVDKMAVAEAYPFEPGENGLESLSEEEFCLGNNLNMIKNYIRTFFESNENYVDGVLKVRKEEQNQVAMELINILEKKTFNKRHRTVCIKSEKKVSLSECIRCIVIPEKLRCCESVKKLEKREKVEVITYTTDPCQHPVVYNKEVNDKIRDYFKKEGRL